ncbi:MAG: Do family serine endopeptidase [Acidobacteria bacterium]|nr:Do family serine endopeptidase [Acidobacteriota bacterium]
MEENLDMVKKKLNRARVLLMALALFVAIGIGYSAERAVSAQQQPSSLPTPADLSRTFVNIAKQVKPAVVNIDSTEETKGIALQRGGQIPLPLFPGLEDAVPRKQKGTGSGVIISPDGYILTNDHVAGKATKLQVKLADGREFKAKLVGTDPETDLAVIKIDAQDLPYAKLGDSDKLEQGEWVIALGSPFGLQQTMTAGIVSALGRDIPGAGQFTNFIQTDASINPGNSGGPLVNMNGEVIGINSMIISRSGASEGVGFAIPANLASKVYGQLVKNGRVTRAYLGLYPVEVTPAIARSLKYTGTEGALVSDVSRGNPPAAKAGLESGDIITEVDGKAIKTPKQLVETVADLPVGKQVTVKFVRDGVERTTMVTLGERPKANAQEPEENGQEQPEDSRFGISLNNLTPQIAAQLKLKVTTGVLVQNVQPDSSFAEAGIRRGDVIHRLNGKLITNRADWLRETNVLKNDKELVLQIERNGQFAYVTVTLD